MLLRRWLIAMLLMAGMAMPLQAEESWQINLKDADIEAFISQVADITGRSFVLDPRVKGKVSVLSSEPMNQEGVYELFLSVLQIHGLAAVPAGDVTLVIQASADRKSIIAWDKKLQAWVITATPSSKDEKWTATLTEDSTVQGGDTVSQKAAHRHRIHSIAAATPAHR